MRREQPHRSRSSWTPSTQRDARVAEVRGAAPCAVPLYSGTSHSPERAAQGARGHRGRSNHTAAHTDECRSEEPTPPSAAPAPCSRQRMPREGMLIQVDGSHHRWLLTMVLPSRCCWPWTTPRASWSTPCSASRRTPATLPADEGLIQRHGIPIALYTDRHSVFKNVPGSGRAGAPTQFSRAMDELGIQWSSPCHRRLRVEWSAPLERSTRLVTELRLAGATTIEEANAVLKEFLDRFNARFGVAARHPETAYRPLGPGACLDTALCFRHSRRVQGQRSEVPLENAPTAARDGAAQLCGSGGRFWKARTAIWLCVTREKSSPARRPHPVRACCEASTALPHTGHPHMAVSTVWAGAGRRLWRHSTLRWTRRC